MCKFCDIYENRNIADTATIENTILDETNNFFIIPAVGSFVKHYVIIVSKRHINSMCYLHPHEKDELEKIIDNYRILMRKIHGFYPIIFEHGGSDSDTNKSACCIRHAHTHIVPVRLNNQSTMVKSLGLNKIKNFEEFYLSSSNKPYIFFMDSSGSIYLRNATDIVYPSQIMRKWIASDMGLNSDEWDWRVHKSEDNIIATIDELSVKLN